MPSASSPLDASALQENLRPGERSRRRIRVLYLIDYARYTSGGTEKHLSTLARELDRDRFECEIVGFDVGEEFSRAVRAEGIPIRHLPVGKIYDVNAFRQAHALRKLIARRGIDIVQTFHAKADTYGVLVSRLAGVRHIVSSRRDVGDRRRSYFKVLGRITNRYCETFITVCDEVGERLTADEGVPRAKQQTIYNGVDLDRFHPTPADLQPSTEFRREIGFGPDDFVVGMIAIFRPEKNFEVFLEAVRQARASIPELKALAVGAGPRLEPSKEFCRREGLADAVVFPGLVRDVRPYISALDVGCLTCGSNEGFSNSVLEQMAMGKPMIVTSVGGNAEAIGEKQGFVLPPNDPAAFAEAIRRLHARPDHRHRMGLACRERAEREFHESAKVREHEQLYEKLVRSAE